jgi:hypothetical protein
VLHGDEGFHRSAPGCDAPVLGGEVELSLLREAASATLLAPPALAVNNGNDAGQTNGNGHQGNTDGFSFGVIGDVPYGDAEIQAFPSYIEDLNAHKELSFVAHAGDIKNGSSQCTDQYFEAIKKNFDSFTAPLVYTPGDNEWTDCHRPNNGAYIPLERLA